jgi:hypothetical protein
VDKFQVEQDAADLAKAERRSANDNQSQKGEMKFP